MDFLIEIIFELIGETIIHITTNQKISKYIRYPLITLITLFYTALILLLIWIALKQIKENILITILFLIIAAIILFMSIKAFNKIYLSKQNSFEEFDNYEKK